MGAEGHLIRDAPLFLFFLNMNDHEFTRISHELIGFEQKRTTTNLTLPKTNKQFPKTNKQFPKTNKLLPKNNKQLPENNKQLPKTNKQFPKTNKFSNKKTKQLTRGRNGIAAYGTTTTRTKQHEARG